LLQALEFLYKVYNALINNTRIHPCDYFDVRFILLEQQEEPLIMCVHTFHLCPLLNPFSALTAIVSK